MMKLKIIMSPVMMVYYLIYSCICTHQLHQKPTISNKRSFIKGMAMAGVTVLLRGIAHAGFKEMKPAKLAETLLKNYRI
jgi:hypothetical protein